MSNIISEIRSELKKNADSRVKISGQRYFREEIKLYGLKASQLSVLSRENFKKIKSLQKSVIFDLCEELWQSGFFEESIIACNWSFSLSKDFKPEDFKVFEVWLNNYVSNWASCDTLCNHTIGKFVEMYPDFLLDLKSWAKSENRWMRRGSAVSLIIPARKGEFLKEIFQIADILLMDQDDLVQKGYGWMLKTASQAFQQQVFDYVIRNKNSMPRTALRYAIEKMPKEWKEVAMRRQ